MATEVRKRPSRKDEIELGKDGKDGIELHNPQQQVNCSLNVRAEGRVMQDLESKQVIITAGGGLY